MGDVTALGSPLVPEVKISMNSVSGPTSASGTSALGRDATSARHSARLHVQHRDPEVQSREQAGVRGSVTTTWQSARATSAARASPRRVVLSPTTT